MLLPVHVYFTNFVDHDLTSFTTLFQVKYSNLTFFNFFYLNFDLEFKISLYSTLIFKRAQYLEKNLHFT